MYNNIMQNGWKISLYLDNLMCESTQPVYPQCFVWSVRLVFCDSVFKLKKLAGVSEEFCTEHYKTQGTL